MHSHLLQCRSARWRLYSDLVRLTKHEQCSEKKGNIQKKGDIQFSRHRASNMPKSTGKSECPLVCGSAQISNGRRIDYYNPLPEPRHTNEVRDVERQHVSYRLHIADGYQPGVVHPLADDSQ